MNPTPPALPVQRSLWRRFLIATGKVIAGALAIMAGIVLLMFGVLYMAGRSSSYQDLKYEKQHEWNGIEVGMLMRQAASAIPSGRHYLVIAFPAGRRAEARALFVGQGGELPEPLDFVRANGSKVTYEHPLGEVTLDVSAWTNAPLVTAKSPRPAGGKATPNEVEAWETLALRSLKNGQPTNALAFVKRGDGFKPLTAAAWQTWATNFVATGHPREAAGAFAMAYERGAKNLNTLYFQALASLAAGDAKAYQGLCEHIMTSFNTTNAGVANNLASVCALGPDAVADLSKPVRLAEFACATQQTNANFQHTLGAILFRAGRFSEALVPLEQAGKIRGSEFDAMDSVFLAMVHFRLGNKEQARSHLAKVEDWSRKPEHLAAMRWHGKLTFVVVQKEAQALVREK